MNFNLSFIWYNISDKVNIFTFSKTFGNCKQLNSHIYELRTPRNTHSISAVIQLFKMFYYCDIYHTRARAHTFFNVKSLC